MSNVSEEQEWYGAEEAADYLGIPMHRLARLRREGRIKGILKGGQNPRYAMYHISELKKGVDISDKRFKKNRAQSGGAGASNPEQAQQEASSTSLMLLRGGSNSVPVQSKKVDETQELCRLASMPLALAGSR